MINAGWRENGFVYMMQSRRQSDGNLIVGIYPVDSYYLGLKDSFNDAGVTVPEFEKMK